jgi:Spy/CpxP family protein refolding chaperone
MGDGPRRCFAWKRRRRVMRILIAVLAFAGATSVCAALRADDEPKGEQKRGSGLAERIQDLNMTDEQESKIGDIRKEYGPKVQEAGKKLAALVKEEVEKIRAVLTPEQKEKVQAFRAERKGRRAEGLAQRIARLREVDLTDGEMAQIAAIRKEYRPKIQKAMQELGSILTDEQKKARAEALKAGKKRREVLAALNLTDEQKEKVAAVCKQVHTLVREEVEKIRDVLSEEQKAKLLDLKEERKECVRDRLAHRIANLKDLNLTEDQMNQIGDIRKDYRPKVQEAGNALRGHVREEVEAIVAVFKG